MHGLDWGVVLVYAALLFGIATVFSRRQTGTDEYFRGSRRLPWWAIGISIIATAFSAASLLGGPGEGYSHGLLWLQLQVGDFIGYALVVVLFIPLFVRLDVTTAYEYLEHRFDAKTRSLGAVCFILFVVVRLGALLYGAALVVAEVAHLPLDVAIITVGIVAIVYTVAGGIAAVIWTDVLQFCMVLGGVGACLWVAAHGVEGGMGAIVATASDADRWRLFDFSWNPSSLRAFPTAVLAYGMLAFAVAGTNQQSVQRYVSCSDTRSAQKAALLAWLTGAVGVAATLLLGVFLFGFYAAAPGSLPADVPSDRILPLFIANELPVGVAGLLVAAVFAAAMSSIDSALHSLATSIVVDFYRRHFRPAASETHSLRVARVLVVGCGFVGIGAAFYVARTGKSLLPFLATYTSYFVGPVLGLFLLGVLAPRARGGAAFWGALVAAATVFVVASIDAWNVPVIWFTALSAPLTLLFGSIFSLARQPSTNGGLDTHVAAER